MPSRLAASMDAPSMMSFLIDYRNSILIIEDAEELIRSREVSNDSGISCLLNLTDGVLGESLCIQVICTFNTKLKNIDSALLRKGRLIQAYEFGVLDVEKTKTLLVLLGENSDQAKQGMTLSDIYNIYESNQVSKKVNIHSIGFQFKSTG
jgi:ATP-dependent 26S proteasome regulatory subunit